MAKRVERVWEMCLTFLLMPFEACALLVCSGDCTNNMIFCLKYRINLSSKVNLWLMLTYSTTFLDFLYYYSTLVLSCCGFIVSYTCTFNTYNYVGDKKYCPYLFKLNTGPNTWLIVTKIMSQYFYLRHSSFFFLLLSSPLSSSSALAFCKSDKGLFGLTAKYLVRQLVN